MKETNKYEGEKEKIEEKVQQQGDVGEEMQAAYKFIPPGTHRWRQRGPYLICTTCEIQHALYIGMEKVMIGENEDSTPKLVERRLKE